MPLGKTRTNEDRVHTLLLHSYLPRAWPDCATARSGIDHPRSSLSLSLTGLELALLNANTSVAGSNQTARSAWATHTRSVAGRCAAGRALGAVRDGSAYAREQRSRRPLLPQISRTTDVPCTRADDGCRLHQDSTRCLPAVTGGPLSSEPCSIRWASSFVLGIADHSLG